jgi:Tfp pilus assembly protein PilF
MLLEDPERTHVATDASRIYALYEAANQPFVQPQGRTAQSAKGVVVALQEEYGFEVLVALTLTESGENVIYAAEPVEEKDLAQALEEGLNFAESMGFILDASGWAHLDETHKQELLARNPAFRPPAPRAEKPQERTKVTDPVVAVARLFAAFCALLLASAGAGCGGMSAEQRAQAAEIHQQLGDNLLRDGDSQQAMKEYLASIENEETPEAHLGLGLIYAWSLSRPDDGEKEFRRALELRADYAEAMTNLGALYIGRGRFGDAVPLLEKASRDPLYKSRVLAQSDLGWALYKSGMAEKGVSEIKGALAVAPKYCLGWRQLGTIYSEEGKLEDARAAFGQYVDACPDVADAHLNFGKVLARQSKAKEARAEFERCSVPRDDKDKPVAAQCAQLLHEMGTP